MRYGERDSSGAGADASSYSVISRELPLAIVGVTELGIQLAQNISVMPELGLRLAGYYDDRPPERAPSARGWSRCPARG